MTGSSSSSCSLADAFLSLVDVAGLAVIEDLVLLAMASSSESASIAASIAWILLLGESPIAVAPSSFEAGVEARLERVECIGEDIVCRQAANIAWN